MEVPGNLSLQCEWAEMLGTEMVEKVNDVGVGKRTGLEPAPMDWKVREETAKALTIAWNMTLKPPVAVKEDKVTILPWGFKEDPKDISGAAAWWILWCHGSWANRSVMNKIFRPL